jgi:hypothetical protein
VKFSRPFLQASVLFILLGFLAFFSILFLGQCYDSNDLLFQFAPWRQFLKHSLAQGILPFWNPYSFCGQPFFADIQTQILYPPNWLTLLPSIPTGISLFIALHWGVAVFGMRKWLRTLDLSEGASRVGALLFAFSGFFWWEVIHPPVLAAFAWVPWWFVALELFTRRPTVKAGWWLGASFAMLFLSGSFQVTLGAAYCSVLFILVRLWKNDRKESQPKVSRWRWASIGAAVLLGGSLLLPQLMATQQFSKLSVRESAGKNYAHFNAYWSLQPSTLGQFLFPRLGLSQGQTIEDAIQDVTGDGAQKASEDNIGNDYLANFGYLGIWLPLLVFFAFRERQKSLAILLSILAFLTLLVCFGKYFFLHSLLCDLAPGFSLLRSPFRFLFLYVLFATALAAMGYQAITRENLPPKETRFQRALVISYAILALLFCLMDPTQCWREILSLLVVSLGVFLLSNPPLARLGRILLGIGLVGPLLLSGWGDFTPHPSSNLQLDQNTPWLDFVKSKSQKDRLWLDPQLPYSFNNGTQVGYLPVPSNAACVWGLKIPNGYNPLRLQSFSDNQALPLPAFSKLTALRWMFFRNKQESEIPGYTLTAESPVAVYESAEPRPSAYAPSHWVVEENPQRRRLFLNNISFDPYQTSFLDKAPVEGFALPNFEVPPSFIGTLDSESPNLQIWKVEASSPLIAVFTDSFYPGWVAEVDGQPTPILEANNGFRAIALPTGSHEVSFRFKPVVASLLWPFVIFWFCAGIALFFFSRLPDPMPQKH